MYAKVGSAPFWGLDLGEKDKKKVNKGARGMPVALGGDEGRDKLRKAAVWLSEAMKDVISCEKPR